MIKKLKNIKNNIANLDNSSKNQAYLNAFDEIINSGDSDLSISEIANDIANNSKYTSSKSPMNRLATGIANFKEGFSENFNNPLQAENLKPVEGKTIGTKIGEVLGTAARFADSPLGRMAIMGGITAIGGGTPMEMLRYGIGAGVLNQGLRNQDSMYRQQLLNSGVAPEALDKIKGYIMPETYNNFVKGKYMHDNTEIDKKYKEGMVDIYKQNAETDREYKQAKNNLEEKKSFVPAEQYYKALLQQGFIDDEEYLKIINSADYDPYELINLALENLVVDKQKAHSKALQVEDDIKTNKQKRYYLNKNDGKQVTKIEYGEKPVQKSVMDINYHYDDSPPVKNKQQNKKTNSKYSKTYEKFLPNSKKKVAF